HLLVNLFVFYTFGAAIENQFGHLFGPTMGRVNFLLLFLLSGVLADLFTFRKRRDDPHFRSVGASGAISGVMFSYVLFYPLQNLFLYGLVTMTGICFLVLDLLYSNSAARNEGGSIDHTAHFY